MMVVRVRCGRYGTLMTATARRAGRRLVARAAAATMSVVDLVCEGGAHAVFDMLELRRRVAEGIRDGSCCSSGCEISVMFDADQR